MDNTINIQSSDGMVFTVRLGNPYAARALMNMVTRSKHLVLTDQPGNAISVVDAAKLVGVSATVAIPVEAHAFYGSFTKTEMAEAEIMVQKEHEKALQASSRLFFPSKKDDVGKKLEESLNALGVPCRIVSEKNGPAFSIFGLVPANKIRATKVISSAEDVSARLCRKIRIYQDKNTSELVAEVANVSRSYPTFSNAMSSMDDTLDMEVPVLLGVGVGGKSVVMDLIDMPHVLVCGTTGSGKSVMVKSMITSMAAIVPPSELGFIVADPKRVEMKIFEKIPHMMRPILTETHEIVSVLESLCSEMDRRYSMLEKYGFVNITQLQNAGMKIPRIVFVIDELADVMLSSKKLVEPLLVRLAQKSRACGIHLVLCTQRPSVDVVTGLLKANIPTRIALRCSSAVDSKVILDESGAEKLSGKGDAIVKNGEYEVRVQAPFIKNSEIHVSIAA